ncbi:MAG: hypothetical protein E7638_01585 [Ruminococcaceae bacterium]|nr:hypothetical protein [Oscillospiraceae bacterium]
MKQIVLKDHGILPGSECTLELAELFRNNPTDTEFVFEAGDYFFLPKILRDIRLSNTDVLPTRKLGIILENMKNVRLAGKVDGKKKTRLLYGGQMQAVTMLFCENVEMKNFIIDWEKPLVSEGIVTAFTDTTIDLFIDSKVYPHRVENGVIVFDIGGGEWSPFNCGQIQYDGETRTIRRMSGDVFGIGRLQEELGGDIYRFAADHQDTAVGNVIVLRHNARQHAGVFTEKCKNITLEDVTVHSCGGLGCLAQFCEDLTYRRVHFLPNIEAGRKVANGRDDGMHITCCSGTVTITECSFVGLMDDPINVHGCCVTGVEWLDARTLRCRYMHRQACAFKYWADEGDDIVFIERRHMTQSVHGTAASYELESNEYFLLTFKEDMPEDLRALDPTGLALDNLTHTAAFVCTKNRFGSCRARGVLVSTPKPVRIADNLFQSSGSAILVAGDSNGWYESGECHDVEICGNTFTDTCLSSMYQFCEGMISICPVIPEPDVKTPYHKNIRIHHNIFDTPDTPVLYGFSTDGLTFRDNRIYRSTSSEKWHPGEHLINLDHSRNVDIGDNLWVGLFSIDMLTENECENVHFEN